MTLQEILTALEGYENGSDLIAGIKAELTKKNNENKGLRDRAKAAEATLQKFGIDIVGDIDTQAQEILNKVNKPADNSVKTELEAMKRLLNEQTAKAQAAEKARVQEIKRNAALTALQAGNATNTDELATVVLSKVKDRDDGTFYMDFEGQEMDINGGVGAWLKANNWAVKNNQNSGAGSTGNNNNQAQTTLTMDVLKRMSGGEMAAIMQDEAKWGEVMATLTANKT